MNYISVVEIAKKWHMSERSVRNYCTNGRIAGAFLTGKTWNIPENAVKPNRASKNKFSKNALLKVLQEEKEMKLKGGIYHKTQIDFTYNSNHIEGSKLTEDQTRYIFETNTLGVNNETVNIDDILETLNHFKCVDYIIENAENKLSESMIKKLHLMLKTGTSNSKKDWFKVGDYKQKPNEVGGQETCSPQNVPEKMKKLIENYKTKQDKTLEDIIEFHHNFESIHPFQDGNGRVGRLIMFKECLANNIVPFIIDEQLKLFYYRGLKEWKHEKNFLLDTCLSAQDKYKKYLNYFEIKF
ncbi:MAG: Fic family protein [Clostridia bacterium]|nr:Fic family protein [Clostridia bacterium]